MHPQNNEETVPKSGQKGVFMPIVVPRRRDAEITQIAVPKEQRDIAWEAIIKAYINKHPEVLQEMEVKQ